MKVRNIEGTSQNACKCGSWLDHWKKFSGGSSQPGCSVDRCSKTPVVGAHVQKHSSTDKSWYIIPLCTTHNQKSDALIVVDSVKFASANVSNTCGK